MVIVGQFCTVESSAYAQYNIKRNDVVYVAGDAMRPIDDKDPYAYRKFLIVARMSGDNVSSEGGFMMEGNNLKGVSKAKQAKLEAIYEADNTPEDEES